MHLKKGTKANARCAQKEKFFFSHEVIWCTTKVIFVILVLSLVGIDTKISKFHL